jgi:hypothetical protein
MMKARAGKLNKKPKQFCALQKDYNPHLIPGKPFISKKFPADW